LALSFVLHPSFYDAFHSSGVVAFLRQALPSVMLSSGSSYGIERHVWGEQLVACLPPKMVVQPPLQFFQVSLAVLMGSDEQKNVNTTQIARWRAAAGGGGRRRAVDGTFLAAP
jgi:hypothetical protein